MSIDLKKLKDTLLPAKLALQLPSPLKSVFDKSLFCYVPIKDKSTGEVVSYMILMRSFLETVKSRMDQLPALTIGEIAEVIIPKYIPNLFPTQKFESSDQKWKRIFEILLDEYNNNHINVPSANPDSEEVIPSEEGMSTTSTGRTVIEPMDFARLRGDSEEEFPQNPGRMWREMQFEGRGGDREEPQ